MPNHPPATPHSPLAGRSSGQTTGPTTVYVQGNTPAFASEVLLSQLLLSFVERRVNPQTIADVVRAQIHEAKISPNALSCATRNGILEVLTTNVATSLSSADCLDIVLWTARHTDFPVGLSARACIGSLSLLLRRAGSHLASSENGARREFLRVVEGVAQGLLVHLQGNLDPHERLRAINVFKGADAHAARLCAALPALGEARDACLRGMHAATKQGALGGLQGRSAQGVHGGLAPTPQDILATIVGESDHVLALKGTSHYRLPLAAQKEAWRMRNVNTLLTLLSDPGLSEFQIGFLVEWFFDGAARDAALDETRAHAYKQGLQDLFAQQSQTPAAVKGLLRAVQRDLSLVALDHASPCTEAPAYQRALTKASWVLPHLLTLAERDGPSFARDIAQWALQLPVAPAESRLFTRAHWQWIRVLATREWEEDLRAPPPWVQASADAHGAQIFSMAPHSWLHAHGYLIVERLHAEALSSRFVLGRHHYDYVEFLVRTLRKKSPAFASRPETLIALKLLKRLQVHEEHQLQLAETRARMSTRRSADNEFFLDLVSGAQRVETLASTPVARALAILCKVLSPRAR
ncbi:MAG: hypothetical protein IOD12_06350 [Silvanigrellales bacterium]|jgi:hypothetical protein|nr:hypothetical protein [Silvanigrellales bacterium]